VIKNAEIIIEHGTLILSEGPEILALAGVIEPFLGLAILTVVFYQLRQIFKTLRAEDPFAGGNASRIRWIGWVIILGELAKALVVIVQQCYLNFLLEGDGVIFADYGQIKFSNILVGLLVLIIAAATRVGIELKEEQSLTV